MKSHSFMSHFNQWFKFNMKNNWRGPMIKLYDQFIRSLILILKIFLIVIKKEVYNYVLNINYQSL
jgi:hypothetical protein